MKRLRSDKYRGDSELMDKKSLKMQERLGKPVTSISSEKKDTDSNPGQTSAQMNGSLTVSGEKEPECRNENTLKSSPAPVFKIMASKYKHGSSSGSSGRAKNVCHNDSCQNVISAVSPSPSDAKVASTGSHETRQGSSIRRGSENCNGSSLTLGNDISGNKGSSHLSTDAKPECLIVDSANGQISASETFITLETKDGLSMEKISLAQFLGKMVLDRESGCLKVDLAHLLNPDVQCGQEKQVETDAIVHDPVISTSFEKTCSRSDSSEKQRQEAHGSGSLVEPPMKKVVKRGRPPKNTSTKGVVQSIVTPTADCRKSEVQKEQEIIMKSQAKQEVNKTQTSSRMGGLKRDFIKTPRRSQRTPAKSTRFGDDFVDSVTLGKISTAPWNAQLMTLALAAERHENKPHKPATGIQHHDTVADFETFHGENEKDMHNFSSEDNRKGQCNKVEDRNEVNKIETERKKGIALKVPKSLKKYAPTNPVVQRSLQDALSHAVEASREHLRSDASQADEKIANRSVYYTIMEPKLEPSGEGLLIRKSTDGLSFQSVNFHTKPPSWNTIGSKVKAYPQDRYFMCDLCEEIFVSSSCWLKHNSVVHQRRMDAFESLDNGISKEQTGTYQCHVCGQRFPFAFMLQIHLERKRHNEGKSFRCTLCKQNFSTHKEREEHWMIAHPARSCGLCGKQFTNIVILRRHINNNCHGARFRKRVSAAEGCAEDNMVILQEAVKSLESNTHEKNNSVEESEYSEEESKETIAGDSEVRNSSKESEKLLEAVKIPCEVCGTEFSTHSGLWHHKLDVHCQYWPPGFKNRLQERLERNQLTLQNGPDFQEVKVEGDRNKFFTIMQPKWPQCRTKVAVGINGKAFSFRPWDSKICEDSSTSSVRNSYEDSSLAKDTIFECTPCEESFNFAANFREHRSRTHGECFETTRLLGAFQCTHCSDTFPCEFMLEEHLKKHVGKKLLPCTLCGLFFHKIQERRQHWRTVHPGIGCPNCGKMYASIKYLQKHISLNCQDHFPPTKKFLEFRKKQHNDFEMESRDKKVEKKIIRCHLCPKLCSSVSGWRRHMSKFHEDAGFSKLSNMCIICNELVYGYKALEKHILELHAEDSGLPIEEENNMVEQALDKCNIDILTYRTAGKNTENISQDVNGYYHCPVCPKIHSDIKILRTHIRTHVNMKLECSICKKTFKNPSLLKQHVQRHRKDAIYNCDTCSKKFMTLQKLNKHRKVHLRDQQFTCELCGVSFTQNDYLQKHMRCHSNKRPHMCSVCGKTFRTKPELRVHVLIHTRETPYECQHCGRGFSQKGNYKIHLAQHTGLKPHQCDQCGISFALFCHLKRHKVTHDQKINYRCIWCGKECTQRKHMHMHVQRVHKEDFFQFEEQMKLETPVPIAPYQLKLYNRRLGKVNKVRKPYKKRAQKCDATILELMNGIVTKCEPMEVEKESAQNIIIEPMVETIASNLPEVTQGSENFEILVSEEHENFVKHNIPAQLLEEGSTSNVEIVMGENNEINIIITDPNSIQDIVSSAAVLDHVSETAVASRDNEHHLVEILPNSDKNLESVSST